MVRSSGVPRSRALGSIAAIVRARATSVTVTRVSKSTGSLDQTTETTSTHTETIYLHDPNEGVAEVVGGERITGDLGGLAFADGDDPLDVQHGDRITYGGVEYEVDTIVGVPADDDADGTPSPDTNYWRISFVRRQ